MKVAKHTIKIRQFTQSAMFRLVICVALALTVEVGAQSRTWTSSDGSNTFEGELKSYEKANGMVTILMQDGKITTFSQDKLSSGDVSFLMQSLIGQAIVSGDSRTNSLGMEFVPVSITGGLTGSKTVLFSVWETRVQDFRAFIETQGAYKYITKSGYTWDKPVLFEQTDTHPVTQVNWTDAQAFCQWLTETERAAGKIGAEDKYRLPTDHEWSCAAGIGDLEDASAEPSSKRGKIPGYPWGDEWPPANQTSNLAGEEVKKKSSRANTIAGYRDGFVFTAPVGSFAPSKSGLYDLGGNVGEWTEDPPYKNKSATSPSGQYRVARGSSWNEWRDDLTLSSYRGAHPLDTRSHGVGFRCVLVLAAGEESPGSDLPNKAE